MLLITKKIFNFNNFTTVTFLFLIYIISTSNMSHLKILVGDESNYFENSIKIHKFFTEDSKNFDLVGYGYFLPGTSFIIAVFHFFSEYVGNFHKGDLSFFRNTICFLNIILIYIIFNFLYKDINLNPVLFFLPLSINIYYIYYLSTFWSDVITIHLSIIFVIYFFSIKEINLKHILISFTYLGLLTYMRPTSFLLISLIFFQIFFTIIVKKKNNYKILLSLLTGIGVYILILTPWYIQMQKKGYDGIIFFTTTIKILNYSTQNLPQNKELILSDFKKIKVSKYINKEEDIKTIKKNNGLTFLSGLSVRYTLHYKEENNLTFAKAADKIKKKYSTKKTLQPYLNKSIQNGLIKYNNDFLNIFNANRLTKKLYEKLSFFIILFSFLTFMIPVKMDLDDPKTIIYGVGLKCLSFIFFSQVFILWGGGGRYHVILAPILSASIYILYNLYLENKISFKSNYGNLFINTSFTLVNYFLFLLGFMMLGLYLYNYWF